MTTVNELVTRFDFEGNLKPLQEFNSLLGNGIKIGVAFVGSMSAITGAIFAFSKAAFDAIDPTIQLSRTTGVAVEAIQELGFVASVSGSNLEAVQASMQGLSEKIGEAAVRGNEDLMRLGISVRDTAGNVKSADRVMDELRGKFRGLSKAEQIGFAQRLGIDRSMIQMLNRSGEEMDKLREQARALGVVTKEQGDIIADVNDSYTIMGFALDGLKRDVALGIAPEMKDFAKTITDLIAENKKLVISIVQGVVKATKALFEALDRVKIPLGIVIGLFVGWKMATLGLAGAMKMFGGVLAFVTSPVTLIVAAVVGLLLIIDDLIVAFRGGKSVIADFFMEFFGVDIVTPLRSAVEWVRELYGAFAALFTDFSWSNYGKLMAKAWEPFVNVLDWIITAIGELLGFDFSGVISNIGDVFGAVGEFFGFGGDEIAPPASLATPPASVTNSAQSASVNQKNYITIEAANQQEAQRGVEDALQGSLRDAADFTKRGNLNGGY